ncbi:kinetochore component CENP-S-domain-containing protein [Peziza echinospora]|nr:kinetochore component CENP-S-domain-containing protein [Peziza echinospora]
MSSDHEEEDLQGRLKAALWHSIGKIVDEEAIEQNVNANQAFIAALTEMVWAQLENTTKDLECFAKHAGRSTITTDDVLLLVRRNEELEGLLREFIEEEKLKKGESAANVAAAGKRKR